MPSRPGCPWRRNLRRGKEPTKVACRRDGPSFRRREPYRRPCRAARPSGCAGGMRTEPELTTALTPKPGRYDIDPGRSAVTFRIRHLFGLAPVRGTFAVRAGTVDIAGPATRPGIYVEIDAASFRAGNGQRDRSVLSPRFLDSADHPVMIFRSGEMDAAGQVLTGTLTVRGVTRPVSLSIVQYAPSAGSFTARATVRIDRTEYGVTASPGLAARYLDVTVEVLCVRK